MLVLQHAGIAKRRSQHIHYLETGFPQCPNGLRGGRTIVAKM